MAATGMRLGESFGLNVEDFDPAAGTLTVKRTYNITHGEGPPKTENSLRTIRVPAPALPSLLAAAKGGKPGQPLFRTRTGKRFSQPSVRTAWLRLLKGLGLPPRKVHQLRHSVATALVGAGDSVADVAKYLGDTTETIARTYLHPTGADPAVTLEKILGVERQSGRKVGGK
jgi:integrase